MGFVFKDKTAVILTPSSVGGGVGGEGLLGFGMYKIVSLGFVHQIEKAIKFNSQSLKKKKPVLGTGLSIYSLS